MNLIRAKDWLPAGSPLPGANGPRMHLPVTHLYIHHSAGPRPLNADGEIHLLRQYDAQHRAKGWNGLGYSFVIGPATGNVYEGRGDRLGAHTEGHNSVGFGIAVLGNYETDAVSDVTLVAAAELPWHLVNISALANDYVVQGHRDTKATACPGKNLYAKLSAFRLQEPPMPDGPPPSIKTNAPPVGIAAVGENSYVIITADGGIFTFGPEAQYHGRVEEPVVGVTWNAWR